MGAGALGALGTEQPGAQQAVLGREGAVDAAVTAIAFAHLHEVRARIGAAPALNAAPWGSIRSALEHAFHNDGPGGACQEGAENLERQMRRRLT